MEGQDGVSRCCERRGCRWVFRPLLAVEDADVMAGKVLQL
jgi:hypothetical protein